MNFFLVSVRDRAADLFFAPICHASLGTAIRGFHDAVNNPESGVMHNHPEDFDLYHMGSFSDHHGAFTLLDTPVQICIGKDVPRPGPRV